MSSRVGLALASLALFVGMLLATACEDDRPPVLPSATPPAFTAVATDSGVPNATSAPSVFDTATAGPVPTVTQAPLPTPWSSPTPMAPPVPETDPVLGLPFVSIGLPDGDCFEIQALVADSSSGRAYALCGYTQEGPQDAVIMVDGDSGTRLATVSLGPAPAIPTRGQSDGDLLPQLAVDPQAGRVYAVSAEQGALVVLDEESLVEVGRVPGAKQVLPAPGAGLFFTYDGSWLVAHRAETLEELSRVDIRESMPQVVTLKLAYNPSRDHLYMAPLGEQAAATVVQVRTGRDLVLEAEVEVPGAVRDLASDAQSGKVFAATTRGMVSIDGRSYQLIEKDWAPSLDGWEVERLLADPVTERLDVLGSLGENSLWLVLDRDSLQPLAQHESLPPNPTAASGLRGRLVAAWHGGQVTRSYDAATGQPIQGPAGRLVLGNRLLAAEADPSSGRLYLVDTFGTLMVLDGESLDVVAQSTALLPVGEPAVAHLALDSRTRRLFAAGGDSTDTLSLDATTLVLVGTLPVVGPMTVDVKGGRVFVAEDDLYVYNTTTRATVGAPQGQAALSLNTVEGPLALEELRYDGDGGRLVMLLEAKDLQPGGIPGFYQVHDGDSLEPMQRYVLEEGVSPKSLARGPLPGQAWLAYAEAGGCPALLAPGCQQGLVLFDGDNIELGRVRGLTGGLFASQDQLFLLRPQEIVKLDPDRGYPLASLALDGQGWQATVDGAHGLFFLWRDDRLMALSQEILQPGVLGPLPSQVDSLIYTEPVTDGAQLTELAGAQLAVLPQAGVYRSADGGRAWQITSSGLQNLNVEGLAFAPDYPISQTLYLTISGRVTYQSDDQAGSWQPYGLPRLAFVSDPSGAPDIYVMAYDAHIAPLGFVPERLTDDPANDEHPSWSGDGQRIVFQSDRGGNYDLWLMNADGTGLVQLTDDPADDLWPAWGPGDSPSSEQIAFVSERDGNREVYILDLPEPGSEPAATSGQRLTDHPAEDISPAWSPTGLEIVFASTRDGDSDLYIMAVPTETTGVVSAALQLTDNLADDREPVWAGPDGEIYFLSDESGNYDIYSVDPDGQSLVRITDSPHDELYLAGHDLGSGRLFFVTEQTGDENLYLLDSETGYQQRLGGAGDSAWSPAWSPVIALPPTVLTTSLLLTTPVSIETTPSVTTTPQAIGQPTATVTTTATITSTPPVTASGTVQPTGTVPLTAQPSSVPPVTPLATASASTTPPAATPTAPPQATDPPATVPTATLPAGAQEPTQTQTTTLAVGLPLVLGTPLPTALVPISAENSKTILQLAQWGGGTVNQVAYSADGRLVAAATEGGVMLYESAEMSEERLLQTTAQISGLAFAPDGRLLAGGGGDGLVRLWRVDDGMLVAVLDNGEGWVYSLAFAPELPSGAPGAEGGIILAAGARDRPITLWRVDDCLEARDSIFEDCGQVLHALEDHEDLVTSLAFGPVLPDGGVMLASGSSGTNDYGIRLWRLADGKLLDTLPGHKYDVMSLALAPDGQTLASGGSDALVNLWDVGDCMLFEDEASSEGCAQLLQSVLGDEDPVAQSVIQVAFGPGGRTLFSASSRSWIHEWQVAGCGEPDGTQPESCATPLRALDAYAYPSSSIAFDPEREAWVAAGLNSNILLRWRVSDGQPLLWPQGYVGAVYDLAMSPDGETVAIANGAGEVYLRNLADGAPLGSWQAHEDSIWGVAYSPDNRLLATGSNDGTVRLWRLDDQSLVATLEGHESSVTSVAFSPDGRLLASGSWDHSAKLWQVSGCAEPSAPGSELCGSLLHTLEAHTEAVMSVAFSPDGQLLASGGSLQDESVRIWLVEDGSLLQTMEHHDSWVASVAFSPDGHTLASASADQTIRLWQTDNCPEQLEGCGRPLLVFEGHSDDVDSVAFSPDGRLLASGSSKKDGTVMVWRVSDGVALKALPGHSADIRVVAFTPDGSLLVSGAPDMTVRLWGALEGLGIDGQ